MIEGDAGVEEKEDPVGHAAVARMAVGNPLEKPHGVVAEITDRPAAQRRQIRVGVEVRPDRQALERREERLVERPTDAAALLLDGIAARRQTGDGGHSEERVSGHRLAALDALEQEALLARGAHAPEEEHGCQLVGRKDPRDRNAAARPGAGQKGAALLGPTRHSWLPNDRRISITRSGAASVTPKRRACRTAWAANIWMPSTTGHFAARAAATVGVAEPSRR